MLVKIIIALLVLPAIISLGMFDYDQNMKNLDSIAGSVAFTYGGVALMFISERCHNFFAKAVFVMVGLLCAGQSGLLNYDAQMQPHREQQNIRKLMAEHKSNKYSLDEIQKCYRSNCKSDDYRQHNKILDSKIMDLESRKDYSWVEPDETTKIKTYGVALLTPLLMNVLGFGLSFTFFQEKRKKHVSALSKLVNWLVRRNVGDVNGNVGNVNGVNDVSSKSSYTNQQLIVMRKVYEKMFYDNGGIEPKQNKWHDEVKRQIEGLKRHDKIKEWWNDHRPNLEPPPAPEQPRPIEVYTSRPAGFTGIH